MSYFILINLTLGIFNLLPFPPMDGGRIAVGCCRCRRRGWWRGSEKFGIVAVLLLLFVLPTLLGQFGISFDPLQEAMGRVLPWAVQQILWVTGHGSGV